MTKREFFRQCRILEIGRTNNVLRVFIHPEGTSVMLDYAWNGWSRANNTAVTVYTPQGATGRLSERVGSAFSEFTRWLEEYQLLPVPERAAIETTPPAPPPDPDLTLRTSRRPRRAQPRAQPAEAGTAFAIRPLHWQRQHSIRGAVNRWMGMLGDRLVVTLEGGTEQWVAEFRELCFYLCDDDATFPPDLAVRLYFNGELSATEVQREVEFNYRSRVHLYLAPPVAATTAEAPPRQTGPQLRDLDLTDDEGPKDEEDSNAVS